ncbi:helix-turn-helix domain-containing protein [Streptomyces flavofungini]|uniref:Helix-turn-helix domain-containing protein n=1 Tax=Streptomyces flavofungini TaxID=68200 RepID=A0ABS0X9N0_9ACTN|nr:helix-turn-helix domain-containing protein [Streptomyces flavofungini]MBJ3809927.1 helix-turn-helix domain-containing protein [Streptomyces flavofungini]GHC54026.1 AraC family transcriptional regulator [Streptomyces flavofungini]
MSFSALHSSCVPPGQRFDWWCELISQDVAPTRITSEYTGDFVAGAGAIGLGGVQVTTLSFPAIRSERTPALIRRSDPDVYELTLNAGGDMWITQARNEARMSAGDLGLWNTSRPFDARGLHADGGASRAIMVHLPRAELPFSDSRTDQLLASATATDRGTAAVFARFLRHVVDEAPSMSDQERVRLGPAVWELAVAFLADRLNAHDRMPPEARTRMLLARVDAFIDDHLADPALTPRAVAARHHISVRTLHTLFRTRERTVAATIHHRRLERCRADLENPGLRDIPVYALAARWGFHSPPAFSRAFAGAYGTPPAEWRRAAMGVRPAPPEGRPPTAAGPGM